MFDNSRFFVGIVKDNDDTHRPNAEDQRQGKVQVRILGIHDILNTQDDNEGRGVDDKDLPWCACLMPNIFGGVATQGTVPNPSLQIGAWVFGVSLDETYQNNIILGIICLPQNMSPSSVASGGFGGGYAGGAALGMINLSTSCLDKYEYSILGVESGMYLKDSDYNWERLMTADEINQKATEGRPNIKGLFQIELKHGTAKEAYDYAVRTGKIQIKGLSKEEVNRKVAESAEFNVICGRAMCEKKIADAYNETHSKSLMYAAGLYNIGCGNFANFISNLRTKHSDIAALDDDTIANEYYEYFKNRSPDNATYLKKLKDQMNRFGGSHCFEEARAGSDLTQIPKSGDGAGGEDFAKNSLRILQEYQKQGKLVAYDQPRRGQGGFTDCSHLVYTLTKAQGLLPKTTGGNTESLARDLINSGNFKQVGVVQPGQINDNNVKAGDILVWREGGKGHTVIYMGGGQIIAAQGQGKAVGLQKGQGFSDYMKNIKVIRRS